MRSGHAGEVVQDMCDFMGIKHLGSEAEFAQEMEAFKEVILKVQSLADNNVHQVASITDDIAYLKQMMVSVEDSRAM